MAFNPTDYTAVRDWLSAAERGEFVETKGPPPSGTTYGWGGGPYYSDAFQFRRAPSLPALAEAYKSIIYTCCRINADAVSRIPLRLYRISGQKGDRTTKCDARPVTKATMSHLRSFPTTTKAMAGAEEVEEITGDHPLLQLIQNVNPSMDHAALINYTVMSMDVVGTGFWWPTEEQYGCPREFWPLPPHLVYPNMAAGTLMPVSYWFGAVEYKPEDLVIFKHLSMKNPYGLGMSPTQAAIEYARLEDVLTSSQDDLLSNGPRPSVIISHKDPQGSFGQAERQRFENDLNRRSRGGRTGAAFVVDGAVSVTPVSWSPADLGAIEISKYDLERSCGCFGVPVSMLTNESSNRAVAEAGLEQHARNAVEPRCKNIASILTRWTHSLDKNGKRNWHKLFWAFDDCVPEDKMAKAELDKLNLDMGKVSRNEVRVEDGFEPVENGDVILVSNSLTTLDAIINPPKPEPASGMPGAEDDTAQPGEPEEAIEGEDDGNEVEEEAEETEETEGDEEYEDDEEFGEPEDLSTSWEEDDDEDETKSFAISDSPILSDLAWSIRTKLASLDDDTDYVWDPVLKRAKPCHDERGHFTACPGSASAGPKKPPKDPNAPKPARKPRTVKPKPEKPEKPAKPPKEPKKPKEKPAKPEKPPKEPKKPKEPKPPKEPKAKPEKPAKPEKEPKTPKEKPAATENPAASSGGGSTGTNFGPSKAKIAKDPDYTAAEHKKLVEHAKNIIGPHATDQDIASIVGAPDNAKVSVRENLDYGADSKHSVTVHVIAPGFSASRTLKRGPDGELTIKNNFIEIKETGTGLGSKVFGRQVEHAVRLGATKIDTTAARSDKFNGYATWPKLGYDGMISSRVAESLPRGLKKAKTVGDLMKTPEGRDAWAKHGATTDMTFDLTEGSQSRKVLSEYLAKKGHGK